MIQPDPAVVVLILIQTTQLRKGVQDGCLIKDLIVQSDRLMDFSGHGYQRIRVVKCTNLVWTDLEVKIRLLAEVLDILFDQMCQLARPPNVDPVIDGTDEAITLCHKCSTPGINEHESQ